MAKKTKATKKAKAKKKTSVGEPEPEELDQSSVLDDQTEKEKDLPPSVEKLNEHPLEVEPEESEPAPKLDLVEDETTDAEAMEHQEKEERKLKTFVLRGDDRDGDIISEAGYLRASEYMGITPDQIRDEYRFEPEVGSKGALVMKGHKPKSMRRRKNSDSAEAQGNQQLVTKHFCPHCQKEIDIPSR